MAILIDEAPPPRPVSSYTGRAQRRRKHFASIGPGRRPPSGISQEEDGRTRRWLDRRRKVYANLQVGDAFLLLPTDTESTAWSQDV